MNVSFCIKHLNIEFKKVSDDQYVIIDLSEYTFLDINNLEGKSNTIKITTPGKEVFEVNVPAGGSKMFSLLDKDVVDMQDGKYCIEVSSCGPVIKKNFGYYPKIKCKIVDLLLRTNETEKYMSYLSQLEVIKTLNEYGDTENAERVYEDLEDLLRCGNKGRYSEHH